MNRARYLLFAGANCYPGALLSDMLVTSDNLDRLRDLGAWLIANAWVEGDDVPPELRHRLDSGGEWSLNSDWWAVLDRETFAVVGRGGLPPYGGWGPQTLTQAEGRRGPWGDE